MSTTQAGDRAGQVEQTLATINEQWSALQEELRQIPDERKTEPNVVGSWSIKDVLGHLAVWDDVAARGINEAVGKPGNEVDEIPWQERNEREAAKRADRSLTEIQAELAQNHERLLTAVRSLQQAEPAVAAAQLADLPENTSDHYAEHLGQIREWRERSDA